MKRDFDLIRQILLKIEADPGPDGRPIRLKIEDYTAEEITYNVGLLAEAGLIHAVTFHGDDRRTYHATGLTWQGHEFLDAARNDTRWNQAKKEFSKMGGVIFPVALEILTKLMLNS